MLPLLLLAALTVTEVPNPRLQGGWVTDLTGVLSTDARSRMNARLAALNRDLGVEIAVVAVPDCTGTPKEFATALFKHWGIGKSHADNGLLVLLVKNQRRLEMETGYGLEPVLPDGWLGQMQLEHMVPAFKRGDYGAGLEAGVGQLEARLRANPIDAREGTRREPVPSGAAVADPGSRTVNIVIGLCVLVGGPVGLIAFLVWLVRRFRRRCPKCKAQMRQLDDKAEDAHLDAGQLAEERVGAVDWQVYVCPPCNEIKLIDKSRWFSGFSKCPKCALRTFKVTSSTTLVSATYDHGGEVEVREACMSCSHSTRRIKYTARRTRPSSTSSGYSGSSRSSGSSGGSSGGSFGGGRSGGGGAGSSW